MDNQHKKIKGYRDLSEQEIDLMNRIKEHGEKTKLLLDEVWDMRTNLIDENPDNPAPISESFRCLSLAKESLQVGNMWFVRAVALPDSF